MSSPQFARRLFNGLAGDYDRWAQRLSLFQYLRWRRFLVSRCRVGPGGRVLDVCTGAGGVAIELARRGQTVVGVDLSRGMLTSAGDALQRCQLKGPVHLVEGAAQRLPFPDGCFEAVVFTFLLRYVEAIGETLRELARVVQPGGQLLSLEFAIPRGPLLGPLWLAYTRVALPIASASVSPGWRRAGRFLGPSISRLYDRCPTDWLAAMWRSAGLGQIKTHYLSLGGAMVMEGVKGR